MDHITISDFDYDLPADRIAQYPLNRRDDSKLLVYKENSLSEDRFGKIPEYLPAGSTLIFNETRVVHARLLFRKPGGSQIEIFCLEPEGDQKDYQVAFHQTGESRWKCLVGHSKRWKEGKLVLETEAGMERLVLNAERVGKSSTHSIINFDWKPSYLTFSEILELTGRIPLPPYITRPAVIDDEEHYQTIYARRDGSVAAPTAGLHFTPEVLKSLDDREFARINFILHVGAGTFRPVTSENIESHEMHSEQVEYGLDELKILYNRLDNPLVLVGTTSVRLMESLYWQGVKLILGKAGTSGMDILQWEPYTIGDSHGIDRKNALEAVIYELERSGKSSLTGQTRLMILPGYRYRYPDILITNFHQPKSTLLLLVAAFIGPDWKKAYRFALENEFRFLSYGDSCLFFKNDRQDG